MEELSWRYGDDLENTDYRFSCLVAVVGVGKLAKHKVTGKHTQIHEGLRDKALNKWDAMARDGA